MRPKSYIDNFFNFHLEDSINSAKGVIPQILKFIRPDSLIDVGCGVGTWLSIWKEFGINNISGVDGSYVNLQDLLIDKAHFITADLDKGFEANQKFELVTCLEVAEHIQPQNAEKLIQSLCNLGDVILFSAAIPGQEGTLHLNEQYPGYWIDLFSKHNFTAYDCIRDKIWNNDQISWWYRQNILFFVKDTAKENYPMITSQKKLALPLVHPGLFHHKSVRVAEYENILKNPYTVARFFASVYLNKIKILLKK